MPTVSARLITNLVDKAVRGEITSQEVACALLQKLQPSTAVKPASSRAKEKSNRRLKSLCRALQRERDPGKAEVLKQRLTREFYAGDQVKACPK